MTFLKSLVAAILLAALSAMPAFAQGTGQLSAGHVWGNPGASQGRGTDASVSAILDRALGSTRGALIERGASGWGLIGPGTLNGPLISGGASGDPSFCSPSGTCLDDITGFSSTGYVKRTGAGAYSFINPIPIADGGTNAGTQQGALNNIACTPTRAGDVMYYNGTNWVCFAGNNSGTQFFTENASGVPAWATVSGTGTVTEQKNTASTGLSVSGNCDNVNSNAGSPCQYSIAGTSTAHGVTLWEGSGANMGNTGAGTTGQALISQGASADPAFIGGAWVLLNTLTASNSATLSDTTSLTSTYSDYLIEFTNIVAATNAVTAELQVHSNAAFQATSYLSGGSDVTSSAGTANFSSTTFIVLEEPTLVANTAPGMSGECKVRNPSQTAAPKVFACQFAMKDSSGIGRFTTSGGFWNGGNTAVDGFQFLMSSGNVTSGTIKIYGRL